MIVPTNRYSSSDSLLTLDQLPNISPITTKLSTTRDTRSTVLVDTRNKLTRRYRLLDAIRVIRGRTFFMKSFHQNSRVITFRIHVAFAGIFRASKHFAQANTLQKISTPLNIKRSKLNHAVHGSLHHVSSLSHPRSYLRRDYGTTK